ncbi:double-stranded RNA-binding 1-like [Olea europaea subsp. europaea]|uniref:Double-stranded RNA-binding 1-like n=1 Tax=Olea europaea subsp. europaea TaxID=158383 RepID=A0A8S0Q1V1_OLEEU|nr:double-stranded RNA-binding 1-like [Olea europaea subsp. europaea]
MLREWLRTPVYETIKEGPSHEPFFKIAVILDNIKYYSVPGFYNRKAAEQSAAEVALLELVKSVDTLFGISQPVADTSASEDRVGKSIYAVVPCKKKVPNPRISTQETLATFKPKECHFKKQQWKKRRVMTGVTLMVGRE